MSPVEVRHSQEVLERLRYRVDEQVASVLSENEQGRGGQQQLPSISDADLPLMANWADYCRSLLNG